MMVKPNEEVTKKWSATCVLTGETMTKRVSHCDVIVRAKAQMPDLLTSPASLHSQSPRVSRRVVWMNSGIRGENVPAATNTTKTGLQSILRQSLFYRTSGGFSSSKAACTQFNV